MKEEIQKILFETELPIKECEALTQELLNLFSVSQQRELLKAYEHFAEQKHFWYLGTADETKEEFLKSL